MKTPEDEAFDELARKQGAWGGGFKAKQAMAADKFTAEIREKYEKMHEDALNYGASWEKDGKRIDPMSVYKEPAQVRHGYDWLMLDAAQKALCEHMAQIKELEELAQPAQEQDWKTLPPKDAPLVQWAKEQTAPPQRPWVGLTEEERASFDAANPKTQEEWDELFDGIEAKLKEKNA